MHSVQKCFLVILFLYCSFKISVLKYSVLGQVDLGSKLNYSFVLKSEAASSIRVESRTNILETCPVSIVKIGVGNNCKLLTLCVCVRARERESFECLSFIGVSVNGDRV
jgi:hypothetical protein